MTRITIVLFIIGFFILVKGADLLVDGASSLAKKLNVSDMVIGLTIVAFGTSAPELVVNITSSLEGADGITIGNIIGSNIANILLILWISAIICPLQLKKKFISREVMISLMTIVLFAIFINDIRIDGATASVVSRSEGLAMIILIGFFVYYLFLAAKSQKNTAEETVHIYPVWKSLLFVVIGLIWLIIGGERIVDGAVAIAQYFWISERIIGLTIIAVGTSLPELATSIVAAKKGNSDLAVGNVVWSCIFNILFILWVSSVIIPIPALPGTNFDLLALFLATLFLVLSGYGIIGKKWKIEAWEGFFMIAMYVWYLFYLIIGA